MEKPTKYKIRLILGVVSLSIGFFGFIRALFFWENRGVLYLLGEYANYICAFSGFTCILLGGALTYDSLKVHRGDIAFFDSYKSHNREGINGKKRKSILTLILAFFVFSLFLSGSPIIVSTLKLYTSTVTIEVEPAPGGTLELYVDSFDNSRTQWTRHGSSPYLDAQDQPSNYVEVPQGQELENQRIGDFGFEDAGQSGQINSVFLYLYCRRAEEQDTARVYLWDGSSWGSAISWSNAAWGWQSWDVSSRLDTWSKIDGALIYLRGSNDQDKGQIGADAAYLLVDYG